MEKSFAACLTDRQNFEADPIVYLHETPDRDYLNMTLGDLIKIMSKDVDNKDSPTRTEKNIVENIRNNMRYSIGMTIHAYKGQEKIRNPHTNKDIFSVNDLVKDAAYEREIEGQLYDVVEMVADLNSVVSSPLEKVLKYR
ncbi:MAG: hypothetical protein ACLFP2_04820 [Candidatus Woesearchaeota archaeon]